MLVAFMVSIQTLFGQAVLSPNDFMSFENDIKEVMSAELVFSDELKSEAIYQVHYKTSNNDSQCRYALVDTMDGSIVSSGLTCELNNLEILIEDGLIDEP